MNDSKSVEDLKSLIFQSLEELGFENTCKQIFTEIGNDLKSEERKFKKITKSLRESASILENVMQDLRAGEMEGSEDDARSIPSISISDGIDGDDDEDDDEVLVVDDDHSASRNIHSNAGRQSLHANVGQHQDLSFGQHLYNENGHDVRVATSPVNVGNHQLYNAGVGDTDYHQSSAIHPTLCRAMTVLNQPAPKPPELAVGMKLFAKRHDVWSKGALVEIQNKEWAFSERKFKIKFDGKGMRVVGSKCIAYTDLPKDNLLVGSRVIALYKDDLHSVHSFYAGIIAEPPSLRNNNRYLVFFDDGYAQYSVASHLHQVCDQSKQVWEDIHPDSQEFIKSYLQQYPERPMVRLYPGQTIKTEWNGSWWVARVQEVDASLVKMYFDYDKRVEWIYRGSTRLEPLYTELANAEASKQMGKGRRRSNINNPKGSKKPFVEYTRYLEDQDPKKPISCEPDHFDSNILDPVTEAPGKTDSFADNQKPPKAVAKKSTSKPPHATPDQPKQVLVPNIPEEQLNSVNSVKIDRRPSGNRGTEHAESGTEGPLGAFVEIDCDQFVRKEVLHKGRMPRRCSTSCLREVNDDPAAYKLKNPLLIPLYYYWERHVTKQKNNLRRGICYRAPCGRVLRSLIEIDRYLVETNSKLTIDLFCFDPILRIDVEYIPVKTFCDIKDLSYGKENVPISCVNGIDRQYPDYVEYSNQRIPAKGVQLCLDQDFLVGCDCTDGCRDRSKCRCIQMTIEATSWSSGGRDEHAGYKNRRLQEPLLTGVFECNSRCKCDSRCHNRVIQHGLTLRLQVFKTDSRGWGLRCLDDIPAGGFICIYAGQLLTDEGANEDGKQYGDEYLAELDYIETVERTKEGYESDVCISDESSSPGAKCSSEEAEHPLDSDSTYSGERKLKRTGKKKRRGRRSAAARDAEKLAEKEQSPKPQPLPDKDKGTATVDQQVAKAQAWLDKMPITISDDEIENEGLEMAVDKPISPENKDKETKSEKKEAETEKKEEENISDQKDEKVESGQTDEKMISKFESDRKDDKIISDQKDEKINSDRKDDKIISDQKDEKIESDQKDDKMISDQKDEKIESDRKDDKIISDLKDEKIESVRKDGETKSDQNDEKAKSELPDVKSTSETKVDESISEMGIESKKPETDLNVAADEKKENQETEQEESNSLKQSNETVMKECTTESNDDKLLKKSIEDLADISITENDKTNAGDKMDEESSILIITDPTSLNVDNVDLDSDDECEESNSNKDKVAQSLEDLDSASNNELKRTTRSQTSRFHNLPDPKSQRPVTIPKTKQKTNERKSSGKSNEKTFLRTRRLFGEEYSYIMDAKSMGNLGRYLNHSCSPNAFVQSVFVDTHDLRYPWVAFFAFEYIRAGTELTWDYNYGIGSVPGKVLYCYCGSAECRGRLL